MTVPLGAWLCLAIGAAPLPGVEDPDPTDAPAEERGTIAAPKPAKDDFLDLPDKQGGDDDDPILLSDEAGEPPPEGPNADGFVSEVEYHDTYVEPTVPTEQAIERDSTVVRRTKKERFKRPGSPQRFALEIKLGPYLPDVDRHYSGAGFGPYGQVFGETDDLGVAVDDPKDALMVAGAFEWQIVYLAGPLGVGLQVAFMRDKAKALIADPVADGESVRSGADSTTFSTLPLALQAVYRLEIFADRWHVPLVPYAKAGVAYAFWWSKDGNGDISENASGDKGRGGSWGYQINAGGMLRMDWIEPGVAREFDRSAGINHTYLFGEYQFSQIDGFGSGNSMSLGDSTWFAGLAIEF